jgi:hypothetical protein
MNGGSTHAVAGAAQHSHAGTASPGLQSAQHPSGFAASASAHQMPQSVAAAAVMPPPWSPNLQMHQPAMTYGYNPSPNPNQAPQAHMAHAAPPTQLHPESVSHPPMPSQPYALQPLHPPSPAHHVGNSPQAQPQAHSHPQPPPQPIHPVHQAHLYPQQLPSYNQAVLPSTNGVHGPSGTTPPEQGGTHGLGPGRDAALNTQAHPLASPPHVAPAPQPQSATSFRTGICGAPPGLCTYHCCR